MKLKMNISHLSRPQFLQVIVKFFLHTLDEKKEKNKENFFSNLNLNKINE